MDKIQELIEAEIRDQSERKVANFISYISKRYHIPKDALLRDWCNSYDLPPRKNCLLCNNKPKYNGYCKKHVPRLTPPPPPSDTDNSKLVHTHTFPPMYLKGCPACDALH